MIKLLACKLNTCIGQTVVVRHQSMMDTACFSVHPNMRNIHFCQVSSNSLLVSLRGVAGVILQKFACCRSSCAVWIFTGSMTSCWHCCFCQWHSAFCRAATQFTYSCVIDYSWKYKHDSKLTHWPLGYLNEILERWFSSLLINGWVYLIKLASKECCRTLLVISQHWSR